MNRRSSPKRSGRKEAEMEEQRLRALIAYGILDTAPEAPFERIARLTARFLHATAAAVSFIDKDRQWFKATCGFSVSQLPREDTFCAHTILTDEVLVVPDAKLDPRFRDNPSVVGEPLIRFYAGVALRAPGGENVGSLCVFGQTPREFDEADRQTLCELAATVVDELQLRRAAAELHLQVAQRERAEGELAEALRSVESQVQARTIELSHRNDQLQAEMASRRVAESALRESELQFRELAENIKEAFWMCNVGATTLHYISPAYETIWDRPLTFHNNSVQAWVDTIHPDDRARVTADFAARATAGRFEEEYRIVRPDGEERWVHDRAFAIRDATGNVYRIGGIAADITERKHQEMLVALRARQQQVVAELGAFALSGGEVDELLREAVRVVQDTLTIDFCGVVEHLAARGVFVVRAVHGTVGELTSALEIPDGPEASGSGYALRTEKPVIVEDTETETRFEISQAIRTSGARSGVSVLIGGDGTHLPTYGTFNVFSRTVRVFSPDDVFFLQGVAHVLAAAISRRRSEEALRIAKEEAELANSAKSSFLSRMSHELRTPLNAILGFSQLLQMDAPTERQGECIRHVLTSGQQLLAMIDDVLDISRLELGHGTLTPEAVVPRDVIPTSIEMIRPLTTPLRVIAEWEDSPAVGRAILINRQRLHQILLNLLSNAVKYNRPGGRVTVSCHEMPAARLRIAVADTGPGITTENFARLFVPFDRLGAEQTDVQGTGLGLALCKNLVEAQGGQIGVESTLGQGSTFWIQFPLAPPAPVPTAPPAEKTRRPLPPARRVPRKRARTILYIEDNLPNLRLIERLLERHRKVRLMTATLGREGLNLARRSRPDLILLDLHLPDLSGNEVLAALQADPATRMIPVVVVSADALPASIEALRAAGARHYLTKPLDVHELLKLLTELA